MLQNLLKKLSLDSESREELDRVLSLPEVEAVLARSDERALEQRRHLLQQLREAPRRHKGAIAQAMQHAAAARERVHRAEIELDNAKASMTSAMSAELAAQVSETNECAALRSELRRSRDRRIDDLLLHLSVLDDGVRALIQVQPVMTRTLAGDRELKYTSNEREVVAARTALSEAMHELEQDLTFSALGRTQMTERLAAVCMRLADPLAALDLGAPTLDERGEIQPPMAMPGAVAVYEEQKGYFALRVASSD